MTHGAKSGDGGRGNNAGCMRFADWHFAHRGWIMAGLFLALAAARRHSDRPLEPAWLALVAAAAAFRFYAGRFIPGHSNLKRLSGSALAFHGPYRFSRHPLYLSNLLGAAGLILFAHCLPPWAAALLFAFACAHHDALARAEERYLAATWGEAYLGYSRVTPMWLGRPGSPEDHALSPAESRPAGWARTWERQGSNLANGAVGALVLWMLAAFPR